MIKFIEKATNEFEQNGRSDAFIVMENKIIQKGNPLQVYFFARYAKGASVKSLQPIILKKGNLEQCFYFQKYINGSNIVPFVKRAVREGDIFWVKHFVGLAKEQKVFKNISSLVEDIPYKDIPKILKKSTFDINYIVETANAEYSRNGRSDDFITLENYVLHHKANASANLFLQHVKGADVRAFERVALLRGDPFNMNFIGTRIEGADRVLMLNGLQLAKLDYVQNEKSLLEQQAKKETIKRAIQRSNNENEIRRLIEMYKRVPNISDYIIQIDNRYIPQVMYWIKHEGVKK